VVRSFEIEVAAPFRLDLTVWALRRRPHNEVDSWDGSWYRRTLDLAGHPTELAVRQPQSRVPLLVVELRRQGRVGAGAADVAGHVLEGMLGLRVDLAPFYRMAEADQRLRPLVRRFEGMRPPRFPTVFEALVNAVACQQLSLTVGIHLLNRLARSCGVPPALDGSPPGFATPERLGRSEVDLLRPLGFSAAKARALVGLASRVAGGDLDLEALRLADDDRARAVLLSIPGIGRWSAEYTMLRGLGRLEVLPGDDVGARNNLRRRFGLPASGGYDEVAELSRTWSPFGGLVYFHLLLDALASAGHVAVPA